MTIETGVEYPTVELGGALYEVKFTRGVLYRLEKQGVMFNPQRKLNAGQVTWHLQFSNIVDVLKECIGFPGTHEELAELCFDQRDEISKILLDAWGNLMLPTLRRREAAAREAQIAAPPASELKQ